ncbi:MAG: sensor domain-containing diguanylate cyclase [Candidatus Sedimenticola sp. (ex Thyasira tokunagai)]
MTNIEHLREMVGLTLRDEEIISKQRDPLLSSLKQWAPEFSEWLCSYTDWPADGPDPLLDGYFESFASAAYNESFHSTQYLQSVHWLLHGVQPSQIMAALSNIRQFFVDQAQSRQQMDLARSLCRVVDISQSIQAMVAHLDHQLERLRQSAEQDIRRINHNCTGVIPADDTLLQSYIAHFQWKVRAYSLALGETADENDVMVNHHQCVLGKWLDAGGIKQIPEDQQDGLLSSHRRLHELMNIVLEKARRKEPQYIAHYLQDVETASEEIISTLGSCLDKQLRQMALEDVLTGLGNRHMFEQEFARRRAQAQRQGQSFGLVFMDMDHFKDINDRFGHTVGDQVLKSTAQQLKQLMRGGDTVFRWGGEEFAALVHAGSPDEVRIVAERLCHQVSERQVESQGHKVDVTISIGATWHDPDHPTEPEAFFLLADQRLNQAKEKGRNCIVID